MLFQGEGHSHSRGEVVMSFDEVVEATKEMALRARAEQAECPCPDCKGESWESYTHCRPFCPAYQKWLESEDE